MNRQFSRPSARVCSRMSGERSKTDASSTLPPSSGSSARRISTLGRIAMGLESPGPGLASGLARVTSAADREGQGNRETDSGPAKSTRRPRAFPTREARTGFRSFQSTTLGPTTRAARIARAPISIFFMG